MSIKALVVDDSRAMRRIIIKILSELSIEVAEAANGAEALDYLTAGNPVDFALVDWNMPEMNGIELVREVRAKTEFDHIPLVMVTSESDIENMMEALTAGANEYVMKPFTSDVLLEKLTLIGLDVA